MIKDILQHNENIDPTAKQLNILREHFPACFEADGSFDLLRFKEEIADKTNVLQEGYELRFLGKSYAKLIASTETTTVLQPNEAHNSLPENRESENIYISGDNLDGLKHLLKSYQSGIKCIYIDPPYNTGSDGFVYRDQFNYTKETLQEKLSVSEEEAERILDLTKRGSASHSAWLMFIYSRLLLARDLLANDGAIFISIDDNEQANLKLLCDDVFGEENFIANLVWEKRYTRSNDAKMMASVIDYILFYRKSENLNKLREPRNEKSDSIYSNPDNDPRGSWTSVSYVSQRTKEQRKNLSYKVENPFTKEKIEHPTNAWKFSESQHQLHVNENRLYWGTNGTYQFPRLKRFLNELTEGLVPTNLWTYKETGTVDDGTKEVDTIIGKDVFDYPKPTSLIKRIMNLINDPTSIILDFFSGSATTAHAVMDLNAKDKGTRSFISIQLPQVLMPENPSQKAAYDFLIENNLPTTLDYIGLERIKRAAAKIKAEHPEKELDLGFKHYILAEPAQNTLDKLDSFDKAGMLADTTILDDFGKSTVLATWLNADGYGLTAEAEAVDLAGYTAYHYKKHLYLIDGGFTLESMKALIQKYDTEGGFNPENLVLFGYSFPDWSINEMIEKNLRVLNDSEKNLKINYSVRY